MTIEQEIVEMRTKLVELEEKVRLKRVVEAFPRALIRPGDWFLDSDNAVLFVEETSDGKGIFSNGRRQWEEVLGPILKTGRRLYTQAEVEAVVGSVVEYERNGSLVRRCREHGGIGFVSDCIYCARGEEPAESAEVET